MSRRMRRAVALLAAATITAGIAVVTTAAGPALAATPQTFYVFADGSDSASCLTPHTACQTIAGALGKTAAGDTVVVGAGSYSGDVTVSTPVTIVNNAGDSPTLTGGVNIGDTGGDVTVQGLTFTGTGGLTVTGNSGTTTLADNVFAGVTATAIELDGPSTAPAMAVTLDGNSGTVAPPARTVAVSGEVTVTTGAPDTITWTDPAPTIETGAAVHVVPGGPAGTLATLTVPDQTPVSATARYDLAITSADPIDHSQLAVTDDAGDDAGLVGDTAPGDTLTGSLPFAAGPTTRTVSLATTGGAPSTLTVTVSLVEYDQLGVPLNRIALGTATVVDNHPPVIADPAATVAAAGPSTITLGPTQDADQQDLTYAIATGPAHGSLGTVAGNHVAYTPDPNSGTSDQFTFTATDGLDTTTPVTAFVTVNRPPTAAATTVRMLDTATATSFALPGSDPDTGQSLTYAPGTPPAHGTLAIDPTTGNATYTAAGAPQDDTFTYTVADGLDTSTAGTVTIQVVHGPVADAATMTIGYDQTSATAVLSGSDSDPTATLGFHVPGTTANGGALVFDPGTRVVTYTPPAGALTDDSFSYTVDDGTFTSAPATVTIGVHHAPVATGGSAVLDEGASSVQIQLQGTADPGRGLAFTVPTTTTYGTITFDSATKVATYTPTSTNLHADSFTYTVGDGTYTSQPGTVTITPNHRPTAGDAALTMTDTAGSATIPLPAADVDSGTTLTFAVATAPQRGTVTIDRATATYTPTGAPQPDSFTFTAFDGRLTSAAATVTIGVNHHPSAQGASASWRCNSGPHALTLHGSDPDGSAITFHKAAPAAHGRVSINAATGEASYTPGTDFVGTDSFSYTVVDATGLRSARARVQITIGKARSRITTALSPARPTSAQHPVLTVHVATAGLATNGVVAVSTGSGTRTARVDKHGTATLSLPSYAGGAHHVSAWFRGTSTAAASSTQTVRFTVTKVASSLSVTTDPVQLTTRTTNAIATVRVAAGPLAANSGVVTIDENGRRLASGTVRRGAVTVRLPRFTLGQHNLTVSYTGTPSIAGASVLQVERVSLGR